ncbi:calcium/sodium antiporter [Bacteroides rhinocerotis]|uniref:calcium/sodium antiporter n=1 Tax=Bacteroides rhinocerotis TaxID=2989541 RepID=UPI0022FDA934|nr:calcium/sodium antiporter [Bacteroides rhinocerotis]
MDILFLVGGLLLILLGANGLTDGAASVAKRFHIPSIVIGLTIVAFGTSAPELTVSISSALKGSADIAIGNVVGSNTFNTLMIVGCTALFAPIAITRNTLKREIPLCILSSFVLLICANDVFLDGGGENILSITDGLLLLCFFAIFLSYTFAIAKRDGSMKEPLQEEDEIRLLPAWKSTLYILGGLAGLIIGGNFFVDGASGIARGLGVSESIIGLTLVAGGTSLPELATSIVAALKKNPEIAIGNVIGSNLFNIFFVLGCSASITPLRLTGITNFDLWVLVGASLLLWLFGVFFGKRIITRLEGSILILCYIAYTAVLIYNL